jgi:hypothetical protein
VHQGSSTCKVEYEAELRVLNRPVLEHTSLSVPLFNVELLSYEPKPNHPSSQPPFDGRTQLCLYNVEARRRSTEVNADDSLSTGMEPFIYPMETKTEAYLTASRQARPCDLDTLLPRCLSASSFLLAASISSVRRLRGTQGHWDSSCFIRHIPQQGINAFTLGVLPNIEAGRDLARIRFHHHPISIEDETRSSNIRHILRCEPHLVARRWWTWGCKASDRTSWRFHWWFHSGCRPKCYPRTRLVCPVLAYNHDCRVGDFTNSIHLRLPKQLSWLGHQSEPGLAPCQYGSI